MTRDDMVKVVALILFEWRFTGTAAQRRDLAREIVDKCLSPHRS